MSDSTTWHIYDLIPYGDVYEGRFPWTVIGVFPTEESLAGNFDGPGPWDWFNYTSGLYTEELWVSCYSIEGRMADNRLCCLILNIIAAAWEAGVLSYGDSVTVPLGIPHQDDADSVWWIADDSQPADRRQVFQSAADACVPILWSSPLGWPT